MYSALVEASVQVSSAYQTGYAGSIPVARSGSCLRFCLLVSDVEDRREPAAVTARQTARGQCRLARRMPRGLPLSRLHGLLRPPAMGPAVDRRSG
jgi:hypothetical protein